MLVWAMPVGCPYVVTLVSPEERSLVLSFCFETSAAAHSKAHILLETKIKNIKSTTTTTTTTTIQGAAVAAADAIKSTTVLPTIATTMT